MRRAVRKALTGDENMRIRDYLQYGRDVFHAASNGDTVRVQQLLANGATVDQANNDGFTALHSASWNGHTACVELLLGAGATVDQAANDGRTALYFASNRGHTGGCVELLQSAEEEADRALESAVVAGLDTGACMVASAGPAAMRPEFLCSLTKQLMQDPVTAADGCTYERAAIEAELAQQQLLQHQHGRVSEDWVMVRDEEGIWSSEALVSPVTGQALAHTRLTSETTLRKLIAAASAKAEAAAEADSKAAASLQAQATISELRCPLTLSIFRDPVIAADGFAYERRAVEEHIRVSQQRSPHQPVRSPMTNAALAHTQLRPSKRLRRLVQAAARQGQQLFVIVGYGGGDACSGAGVGAGAMLAGRCMSVVNSRDISSDGSTGRGRGRGRGRGGTSSSSTAHRQPRSSSAI